MEREQRPGGVAPVSQGAIPGATQSDTGTPSDGTDRGDA